MNDNLKFWVSTFTTALLYYFSFSFADTSIFYIFFMSLGTFALFATVYYLSKQKLMGLLNFVRYFINKGRR